MKLYNNKSFNIFHLLIIILLIIVSATLYSLFIEFKKYNKNQLNKLQNISFKENNITEINNNEFLTNTSSTIPKTPLQLNALERIYNPLKYPYKSDDFYQPSQVIGCGSRSIPCSGTFPSIINNPTSKLDISNNNISPVYISTRGPWGEPQQMGTLYKIFGNENQIYPLFGRRKFPNSNDYEYYTTLGPYETKVKVITPNKNYNELGTNDEVTLQGLKGKYRVTLYDTDYPQYVPYV